MAAAAAGAAEALPHTLRESVGRRAKLESGLSDAFTRKGSSASVRPIVCLAHTRHFGIACLATQPCSRGCRCRPASNEAGPAHLPVLIDSCAMDKPPRCGAADLQ